MTTTTNGRASKADILKGIGGRGISVWSGIINEEYLSILRTWSRAAKVYIEMADDATIGTLQDAIRLPLLAADFDVMPGEDTETDDQGNPLSQGDAQAMEFLWKAMNHMELQTWRSHVEDMLDALTFGWAAPEIVLAKRDDGRLWLKNIEPRGQETLERWQWEGDQAVGYRQQLPDGTLTEFIPLEKTVHIAIGGRKGNPQGRSLLRSLHRPWYFVKNLENFEGIKIERDAGGMPTVEYTHPEMFEGYNTDQLREMFEDALKGIRADEEAYFIPPPGAKVVPYASGGTNSYDIRGAIVAKQKEILMRFFAQWLFLGMDKVGTQALVQGETDFFSLAMKGFQQMFLEAWNQQLVPLLFRFNSFPGMTGLPQIMWHDPGKVDIGALLEAYSKGVQSRLITPTREDEESVRAKMDLPDLPEGVGDGPREPMPSIVPPSNGGPLGLPDFTPRPSLPAASPPAVPTPEQDLESLALNGAQIASLLSVIQQVTAKQLDPETAKALIRVSFPSLTQEQIDSMVDSAARFQSAPVPGSEGPSSEMEV